MMTAALAQEMGLEVHYQVVLGEESWSRSSDMYFVAGHVNLTLERRPVGNTVGYEADAILLIDFLPGEDLTGQRTLQIGEATILAMYLNNRAAESMSQRRARSSLLVGPRRHPARPLVRGRLQYPGHHPATPRRHRTGAAHARPRTRTRATNTVLLSNLAQALEASGTRRPSAAAAAPPAGAAAAAAFPLFQPGPARHGDRRLPEAARLFKREIARDPYYHEFHFWLAQAYARLGQLAQADKQLELAMDNSTTRSDHGLYAAKLQRLRAATAH